MKEIAIFIVVLFCIQTYVSTQEVTCEPNKFTSRLPPKYDPSLEPERPINLTGMVAVITGCSSRGSHIASGQAGALARLLHDEDKMIVICLSRHPKPLDATWDEHIVFDLRDTGKVSRFVNFLLPNILESYNATRVNYLGLFAGQMEFVYPQDNNAETEEALIVNNYLSLRDLEDKMRRANLLKRNGYTRISWRSSIAAFGTTGMSLPYEQSKLLITNRVRRATMDDMRLGYDIVNMVTHPDTVSNTSVSCDTDVPTINNEVCGYITNNMRNSCPFPAVPVLTTALDTALMERSLMRTKPQHLENVAWTIDAAFPLDAYGHNWHDKWRRLYLDSDPRCYAKAWIQDYAGMGKAVLCSVKMGAC